MASDDYSNERLKINLRVLSYLSGSDELDSKLDGLRCAKGALGEQAADIIMLGLSRPISPTAQDTRALISEWESRDDVCCFHGSQEELLAEKDVYMLAVSYKHDEHSRWKRKGGNLESRMSQEDQDSLVTCIVGLGWSPNIKFVFIWCDRILSTRLSGRENSFGWYNAGLLPYLFLPVLTLTSYIPDEQLESRIWIKAERTLGRLGNGILKPNDARLGLFATWGGGIAKPTILENVALMMLSGYWPADTGFWAHAYEDMKSWALGLICRKQHVTEIPLFEKIKPVDNMEILANLSKLVMLPKGIEEDEKPLFTDDSTFFLKATAWNLSLEKIWDHNPKYVSHYIGNLGSRARFTWWTERRSQSIFGYFVTLERACLVLAVRDHNKYKVFRREGNPIPYRHKEIRAGIETKLIIADVARKCHVSIEAEAQWDLLYYSDDAMDLHKTHPEVKTKMRDASNESDSIVPSCLVGHTTSILRAALKMRNVDSSKASEAVRFVRLFEDWNSSVKKTYKSWVSVRDTLSGPVWLEGYNEEHVSFGFLDMLTRCLIGGGHQLPDRVVRMPSKWDFLKEVRRVAELSTEDVKLIEKELYGNAFEENCESEVMTKEVARGIISGAFSSVFNVDQLRHFLKMSAEQRGYWHTAVYCRNREIQIIFRNRLGVARIVRRQTELEDFRAAGIVRHEDSDVVMEISEEIIDDVESTHVYNFWARGTVCKVSKRDIMGRFSRSCQDLGDGKTVCLVDMTVSTNPEKDICSMVDKIDQSEERHQLLKELERFEASFPSESQPETSKELTSSASILGAALSRKERDFEKRMVDARLTAEKHATRYDELTALVERTVKLHRRSAEMRLKFEEKDRQQSSVTEEKSSASNLDQPK